VKASLPEKVTTRITNELVAAEYKMLVLDISETG
jgi:hypothetical protein